MSQVASSDTASSTSGSREIGGSEGPGLELVASIDASPLPNRILAAAMLVILVGAFVTLTIGATKIAEHAGGATLVGASWGLLLLASFAGWGALVDGIVRDGAKTDAPLRTVWGLSASLAVGGVLCSMSLAYRPVLLAWVLGGLVVLCFDMLRARPFEGLPRASAGGVIFCAGVLGLAAVTYIASAGTPNPNPADDWIAYLIFPKQILYTGGFVDAFSLRRMGAFGGKSLFDAFFIAVAPIQMSRMVDAGLCVLLLAALPFGWRRLYTNVPATLLLLLAMYVMALPDNRVNAASSTAGAVMFVGLYRTVELVARREGEIAPWRRAALVGMVAAALCTLRQNFILPAVLFLFFTHAARLRDAVWKGPAGEWRNDAVEGARVAACSALFLLPWAIMAQRSNGSFLFPIVPGNYDVNYDLLRSRGGLAGLRYYFSNLMGTDSVIKTTPLLLIIGLILPDNSRGKVFLSFWLACILGFAYLTYSLPIAGEPVLARYYYGFMVAYAMVVCAVAFNEAAESLARRASSLSALAAGALALFAVGLQLHLVHGDTQTRFVLMVDAIAKALEHKGPWESADPGYEKIQAQVPAHEGLLTMVEHPYWFDFTRNRIEIVDTPGSVSPPPGLPWSQGADAAGRYLLEHGIRYFVFAKPDHAAIPVYSRAPWVKGLTSEVWGTSARYYLACFDALDGLASSRRKLFDDGHLVLVDLASPAAGS